MSNAARLHPDELAMTPEVARRIPEWVRRYVAKVPVALAVREVNRLIAIELYDALRGGQPLLPVLDVGCGDAFWWSVRGRDTRQVFGTDISEQEISNAAKHIAAELSDISRERPFPDVTFRQVIGNCSLEHVRDIDAAVANIRRCTDDNAEFVLFVPTPAWAYDGGLQSLLLARAPRVAMAIAGALNGYFQHWHLYDSDVWSALLARHGFEVERVYGLGNAKASFLFRAALPASALSFGFKSAFGSYPEKFLGRLAGPLLSAAAKAVEEALATPIADKNSAKAYEYMIVARAVSHVPSR